MITLKNHRKQQFNKDRKIAISEEHKNQKLYKNYQVDKLNKLITSNPES